MGSCAIMALVCESRNVISARFWNGKINRERQPTYILELTETSRLEYHVSNALGTLPYDRHAPNATPRDGLYLKRFQGVRFRA